MMMTSLNSFDRLDPAIRHYIYDQGWQALRPIQETAIRMVMETDQNLVLASPTASGKTEAAYLPAISTMNWGEGSVRILTLSPLIALINDQFKRIHDLCRHLDIPVVAWHGEASSAKKKRILERPAGIVIMTPESLEAMLDLHPERADRLFSGLEWVLVDEVHSFLGTARGVQVRSLLARLMSRIPARPRFIGMSATLARDNIGEVKAFFPSDVPTRILMDSRQREIEADLFLYREEEDLVDGTGGSFHEDAGNRLLDGVFDCLKQENLLIFPNSRKKVEETADGLKRRARKEGMDVAIFAHHSSVEKALREEVEAFVKQPNRPFAICATSTLELGIDIGSVDAVVQVEAPPSAISLSQRLGRSGRGEVFDPIAGKMKPQPARLHFFASRDEAFLQGVAALDMVRRGELDGTAPLAKPYDVLAHQVLALILERSGMALSEIFALPERIPALSFVSRADLEDLLDFFLDRDYIEILPGQEEEAIIGLAGEKIVGSRDFYALFQAENDYEVVHGKDRVGKLPLSPDLQVGFRFLLTARVWEVTEILDRTRKILVKPASQGKGPTFGGQGMAVSGRLRRRMVQILRNPPEDILSRPDFHEAFSRMAEKYPDPTYIQAHETGEGGVKLVLFIGTAMERTLYLQLLAMVPNSPNGILWNAGQGTMEGPALGQALSLLRRDLMDRGTLDRSGVRDLLEDNEPLRNRLLTGVKYAFLLPTRLQVDFILDNLCEDGLEDLLVDFWGEGGPGSLR